MKKKFKKSTAILLVFILIFGISAFQESEALTPTEPMSSSYKSSVYYQRLCAVELTGNQRNDIIAVAESQMGYYESNSTSDLDGSNGGSGTYGNCTEYGYWYGQTKITWCAVFVSWCATQAGISTNIIKKNASAKPNGSNFGVNTKSFGDYNPQKGDIAYIKTTGGNHVGLVYKYDDDYIYTIEGNVGDGGTRVKEKLMRYSRSSGAYEWGGQSIVMFGIPNYTTTEPTTHTHNYNTYSHFDTAHPHYSYYKCSCGEVQVNYNTTSYSTSCVQCNPSAFCANLGDDFYGVILNTACWKPISKEGSNNITLETESGISAQKWRFQRQSDGAYVITSCYDGTALEMTDGIRTNSTQMSAKEGFWGGYYQQWYLIPQGSGVILLSKHYSDEQWVMDLYSGNTSDGTPITIHPRNNTNAQIWSIYNQEEVQLQAANLSADVDGTNVTFTWPHAYGATSYSMKIHTEETWYNKTGPYQTVENVKSGFSIELPAGKYFAYIDSEDYYSYIMSNVVSFEISSPELYTVSYNANGGSGAPSSQTKNHDVSLTLTSTIPTKKYTITYNENGGRVYPRSKSVDCKFLNWNTAANGNGTSYNAGATYSANSSVTLYAQWATPTAGTLAIPSPPSGYSFDGWYTAASGGTKVTASTVISKDTTIYAHWTKNATPTTKPTEPTTKPSVPTTKPAVPTTKPSASVMLDIRKPSQSTITYGDSIILHADVENLPSGAKIVWETDNSNFTLNPSADGTTCTVSPSASGDTVFTAKVVDATGNEISSDTQSMTSKAGFFQKIIAFFKGLFGLNKVIPEAFKSIF